ncbi:uncharacterized protein PV07_07510 [Cladophialophora immunda]|uniref:Uncharacterized protein n=1 Tax=Cladophialophora immunda TaxID=569365 RepID=A0A0D2C9M9_9EURO|nr:uncharacterized protein PV07_07510 [Cladophialophora immunda]KIW27803.1 hypothetical protein PV07_07510 [Cladophialophora immunda]
MPGTKLSLDPSCVQIELMKTPPSESKGYHIWKMVVEKYSGCDLTREDEDKFVAISGLAKNLGPPEDYLAGLWKYDLPYQLLWKVSSTVSKRNNSGTPIWSWASMSGSISYHVRWAVNKTDEEILISVVDAATVLKTADLTGSVRRGFVEIHGPLVKVEIKANPPDQRPPSHLINGSHWVVTWDVGQWNRFDWTHGHPSEVADVFWAMPIEIKQAQHCLISGLVLEAIPGKPALRRAGFFSIANTPNPRGLYVFLPMLCHADYMPDEKLFAAGFCDERKQAPAIKRYRFLTIMRALQEKGQVLVSMKTPYLDESGWGNLLTVLREKDLAHFKDQRVSNLLSPNLVNYYDRRLKAEYHQHCQHAAVAVGLVYVQAKTADGGAK